MYVNMIDDLFDGILNKFNDFLTKEKAFQHFNSDTNFVKFQNEIMSLIKKFIETIPKKDIIEVIKNESYYEPILNIIKRYCAFYIYLGIGYYYEGGRDLFITNMIEASKYQKDSTFQITNFFNSENNSKIITFYNDIKNFLSLLQYKTIDKIKIILLNNPLRFESTIKLFNDLGEDHIVEYFLIKENFHNVMKALIFKQIYLKEEKNEIIAMLEKQEKQDAEYKYIEIVVSNEKKIVDFNVIQKFLTLEQLKSGMAEEIYTYLEEMRDTKNIIIRENQDFINYLFSNGIIIPMTEDFLRYHKDTEKYDPESLVQTANISERDATKIKYIVSKMNNIRNYYSPLLEKNPKLKLETDKLFYKPLDPKLAVLYNNDEETKIIQKLELSENATDFDLLVDLENIRKYAFVNFKNFSKEGIKIRPDRTIQAVRYTNIKNKHNKDPLDLRIGHDSIDMNVVGIVWNPSKMSLDCFQTKDLLNASKILKEDNGYKAFVKIMNKTFLGDKTTKKLYYWLFNNSTDKVKSDSYINYSSTDATHNIKIMIGELYNNYIKMVKTRITNYLSSVKDIDIWEFNNIIKGYSKKYFNFDLIPAIKNELIEMVIINKIPQLPIIEDDVDNMIPGKRDKLIKLPTIDIKKINRNLIILGEKEIDVTLEMSDKNIPICMHYVKWNSIIRMSKKSDDFNQAIFDYVKQYVKLDDRGEYMCKSCNEGVNIKKYVYEGTYVEELDTFMTTSMAVNQKLEEIPKYSKYMRSIRNIEKSIEKFAYSLDLLAYLGNDPVIRLRRRMMIKDIIDLVLMHTAWLRHQPKNRIEMASKKYGINKDLTNLFFFELKDDIFLTSSTDTDYYKLIKYNNIMAYLLLVLITELNSGQILSLREDKRYNYFLFKKIGISLFNDMYLRVNMKDKTPLSKLPLLAYVIYYLSGMMVSYRLWLYNDKNVDTKDKPAFYINTQKTIIHTVLDLLNSLIEANLEQRADDNIETKNFLYEVINTRINDKIKHTYSDEQLLKRVEANSTKNMTFDESTKKITFHTKKIPLIDLNIEYKDTNNNKTRCDLVTSEIDKITTSYNTNDIDLLTNCSDGRFHSWAYKSGDMICSLCSKSYNELVKVMTETTETEKMKSDYLDRLKLISLRKLAKKYCISGEVHDIDINGKCLKCNVVVNDFKPNDNELKKLEKNLETKSNDTTMDNINKMREYYRMMEVKKEKTKEVVDKFNKNYDEITRNNIENYIEKFVDRLSKILGNKIKVKDTTVYLKETVYIIDHDQYGNTNKDPIYILSSENKINITHNHPSFNKDVLWYKNKATNVYVYYDPITLQHLGYSDDNKVIKRSKNNASIEIILSMIDTIKYLGYENQYYNMYHSNKDYIKEDMIVLGSNMSEVVQSIIRSRMANLKQIIERAKSMVYNIRNSGKVTSGYNNEEKEIVSEFTKKLKQYNVMNIFDDNEYIVNNITVNYNIPANILDGKLNKNYLDVNILNNLHNNDSKLIFFLIYNFNLLLDHNTTKVIESELGYLIIRIIRFLFNLYYRPYSNYNVRKFDFLLINETPYIDETLKVVGHYMELLTQQEIDDPDKKEEEYSAQEAFDSLDIDDYEKDDDIDGTMEALDGYED